MANIDAPRGFAISGAFDVNTNSAGRPFKVFVTNANPIAIGDIVNAVQGGVESAQTPVAADAMGVVTGILTESGNVSDNPLPALTAGTVLVQPLSSNMVFKAQTDEATVINETAIGQTIDFIAGAPDPQLGNSTYELDSSTLGVGTIFKIIGIVGDLADNEFGEANPILLVASFSNFWTLNTRA